VPGADEEAPRRWQTVRPLHLPEVRLPAHDPARPETTQPRALTQAYLVDLVCFVYLVDLVHLIGFVQPKNQTNPTNQMNKPATGVKDRSAGDRQRSGPVAPCPPD